MYTNDIQKEIGSADADVSGTGDLMTFTPSQPVEIIGFGYIVTTAIVDAAGGLVLKADKRPTAGSDSGRGDGDAGIATFTSAQANKAAGGVIEGRPSQPLTVYPGQQVVLELTTAPDSGAALPFINYRYKASADRSVHTAVTA